MVNGVTPQLSLPAQLPRGIEGLPQWSLGAPAQANSSPSFKEFMLQAIDQVNAMQLDADQSVEHLLTGGDVNPAEVLTAVQKADLSFRMMLQVRNKLVQAFQEIKELRI